jgi:protein required for attachment to host cells
MSLNTVVVADSARARFFVERFTKHPAASSDYRLEELADLIHPEARLGDDAQLSDPRTGSFRSAGGAPGHSLGDHRDARRDEQDKQFAAEIIQTALEFCRDHGAPRIILAADPRMLGLLRNFTDQLGKQGIALRDIAKDFSRMRPDEIHSLLTKSELLPWMPEVTG